MFVCVHGPALDDARRKKLLESSRIFSPHIESLDSDTWVFDVRGSRALFGSPERIAGHIARDADKSGIRVQIAIAANPAAAFLAARNFPGISRIQAGEESTFLAGLPVESLHPKLAGVDEERAREIIHTLRVWGIARFGEFTALPERGLAERLGDEAIRLQRLARGDCPRPLVPQLAAESFQQSIELEHPILLAEPLSFIFSRLLNQLCLDLKKRSLATHELRLCLRLETRRQEERKLALPFPMRDPRSLLKLLELEIERNPPEAGIVALSLAAEPAPPRALQHGLFVPLTPAPEKLELILSRLIKLAGTGNVGSAELMDTHRPGAFRLNPFIAPENKARPAVQPSRMAEEPRLIFRAFRPPLAARVEFFQGRPARLTASRSGHGTVQGKVVLVSGPWRTTGDWWTSGGWAKDEWEVVLSDGVLYRIALDLATEEWFLEGLYD